MACTSADLEFTLTNDDLTKANELLEALNSIQFAITMLSKNDCDLLYANKMLQFVIQEFRNSEIAQELKIAFETRVLARRNKSSLCF